eukprot:CAMPEP_0114494952 /NCGR_PEP_ID=MMETSP0109-20121206/4938_1 /TAXON_ID=29199 /ORGANISM="Chlorarachnion reptans, Strain CCCM449" /LENGTH=45 /DNA_ID= /DNA_START= /DNA_END= /DNA_ORIENTATION=
MGDSFNQHVIPSSPPYKVCGPLGILVKIESTASTDFASVFIFFIM